MRPEASPKTVLLLGAGASAASQFHLPTMRGFFTEPESLEPPLPDFLHWFYADRPASDYNLEEVLAFLDISRARLGVWGLDLPPKMRFNKGDLYQALLRYTKARLRIPDGQACSLHTQLIQSLKEDDSIITLNYDVIVERSLKLVEPREELGHGGPETRFDKIRSLISNVVRFMDPTPGLIGIEAERGFYLKLHGSLDWLQCPTPGCPNHINLYSIEVSGEASQREGVPCRICGVGLQVFIVPPVATKRLEDRSRIAFLWNLALRELRGADRLVVIGVSFAPSDFELWWLLRQAISLREEAPLEVSVVDPDEEREKYILTHLPEGVCRGQYYKSLEEYVTGRP